MAKVSKDHTPNPQWARNSITGMMTHPYAGAIDVDEYGTCTPSITGEPCATEEDAMAAAEKDLAEKIAAEKALTERKSAEEYTSHRAAELAEAKKKVEELEADATE